jgi:hypothetical protein
LRDFRVDAEGTRSDANGRIPDSNTYGDNLEADLPPREQV